MPRDTAPTNRALTQWTAESRGSVRKFAVRPISGPRTLERVWDTPFEMHKLWCAVLGLNQSTARRRALRKNMMDNRDYPSISCKPLSVRDSWPDTSWVIICVLPHVVLLADGGRRNRHRHHFGAAGVRGWITRDRKSSPCHSDFLPSYSPVHSDDSRGICAGQGAGCGCACLSGRLCWSSRFQGRAHRTPARRGCRACGRRRRRAARAESMAQTGFGRRPWA